MFKPTANPDLVTTIVNQMSIPSHEMGISAMYEIFKWSAIKRDTVLSAYADKLRNINAEAMTETEALHESVTVVPGAGHFVPQVKPVEFNQALKSIVREIQ